MSTSQAYTIAHAAITGIVIPPVFILWILSQFQARWRKDPVRDGVPWMKLAYPFFFLSLILTVASDAMFSVTLNSVIDNTNDLFEATNYLSLVGGFLEQVATTFAFVAFVELGMGFYTLLKPASNNGGSLSNDPSKNGSVANPSVSDDGNRLTQRRTVRIVTAVLGVVLLSLSVALLGKAVSAYVVYYRDMNSINTGAETATGAADYTVVVDNYLTAIRVVRQLGAAFDILVWVLSLPFIGFAGYLVHRAQGLPIKGATVLLLVASLLWFVRFLWHLIYDALWVLPPASLGVPMWFDIADPLLNVWTFFVVLVLLYVLAARRMGGLWSTAQPWTQFGAPAQYGAQPQAPYQYAVYNPNYVPAPQDPVYQMPGHEQQRFQPQTFHEMPNPVAPVYPQEMYAPQQQYQYQGHPQQQQQQCNVQQSPSPQTVSQSQSPHGIQPTPPPPSGTSATPPSELKS